METVGVVIVKNAITTDKGGNKKTLATFYNVVYNTISKLERPKSYNLTYFTQWQEPYVAKHRGAFRGLDIPATFFI